MNTPAENELREIGLTRCQRWASQFGAAAQEAHEARLGPRAWDDLPS